ncbi:ectopic P granules protein 5 homolog [Dendronephthya gigantea]|uniref:ectopic P granules protein 5 homolog n=1 Tax=Dendronephthya gigantea TaxID=151771 RepID=UPI00106B63AF|nr:ectopic P granules protein 5 homolog [Dendronephthya gigantea]
MAEAVRPVKKKRKAKKTHAESTRNVGFVGEDTAENKRDAVVTEHDADPTKADENNSAEHPDHEASISTAPEQEANVIGSEEGQPRIDPTSCESPASEIIVEEDHKEINAGNEILEEVTISSEIYNPEANIDEIHTEIVVDNDESSNENLTEEHVGIVQDDGIIREGDVHNVLNVDSENQTDKRLMDDVRHEESNGDSGVAQGVSEENDIPNSEGQEGSLGEVTFTNDLGSDTSEKMKEIGEQLDNLVQEKSGLSVVLPQEDLASSSMPEENMTDPGLSEVPSSVTEQIPPVEKFVQDENVYENIHNIFGKQQVSTARREAITAFTEDDLKSFYYNPSLLYLEECVESFIQETLEPRRESEFFELLNTYQNTSKNLRSIKKDIELLRLKCVDQKKSIWSTETKTATVQGICQDFQKVSYTHSYEVAVFNSEQAKEMSRTLDTLKSTVHETFTLAEYSGELARVHIMSYIYELHAKSPVFCGVTQDSPVAGVDPSQVSHAVLGEIQHLRDCISALFHFMRKPTDDEDFIKDINLWLENLVGLLLRVATLPDHVFILNHVLRCPPGVTRKLAHFVQPLLLHTWTPVASYDEYFWQNPLLHHFVTMLANLLLPIKLREKYLLLMKSVLSPDGSESPTIVSWVMVDEDGEEDLNLEESWMLIPENDFVALFSQFAFDALFEIIIGGDTRDGTHTPDWGSHDVGHQKGTKVIRVFAFSTCLIQMLGKAFTLYSMRRYREFVKRLGRAISSIVMRVSRYWSSYKTDYVNKYGDNEITFHLAFGSDYSLEKLQMEYDQFFIRASQQILSANKLGVWQFLIDMPFYSLSSRMTWICYRFLHRGTSDKAGFSSLSEYIASSHTDQNEAASLLESFKAMTEPEIVFLLTTFANMARERSTVDIDFINAVVREIYEVSYLNSGAPDFLPKTGKDLLGSICQRHAFVMSLLLERVEATLDSVREECVGLFQALPVETWRPKVRDVYTIRNWLLHSAVESSEHQLSRYLLTNINWQYQALDSDTLYLPQCIHRAIAILLVETCALRLSNRPGGIEVDVFKETPGILEQVTQVATHPYQRILQHFTDQELYKWLWEVVMFLHLHQVECPPTVMEFTNTASTSNAEQSVTSSYDKSEFFKNLSKPEPLDLDTDEALVNVLTSANKDGPLACFVALQLSTYGHDPHKISDVGLTYMSVILDEGHVFPTCRIIENTVPTFFTKELLAFSENSRFTRIIDSVIHSGVQWREQDVVDILSGIIQKHVKRSSVVPDADRTLIATEFWLRALCCLPNWNTDANVLQLLNNLLKCVFRNSDAHMLVLDYFIKKHQDTLKSLKDHGFLSSLFSFVISYPSSANLVDIKTNSQFVYFCYFILSAESAYQEQCGLKSSLANKLHDKPEMCIETAVKKASSSLKDVIPIPACNLDIYRWADLALSTDHEEPILAVIWQNFFLQFLRRVPAGPGLPERGSVGIRFFESTANTTYLKKLKARLMGTAEYHKERSILSDETDEGGEQNGYKTSVEVHQKLARLFQTLALWLDESRLHDPTLFIQGLPPAYDPDRLTKILKRFENLWLDCIDLGLIDWQLVGSLQYWIRFNKERQKKIVAIQKRNLIKKPARLPHKSSSSEDIMEPPLFRVLSTPIPECPVSVLMDRSKIMDILGRNLAVLSDYARKFMMKLSTNSALDFEYMDMLRHIFENVETELRIAMPCHKKSTSRKGCKGAASLIVKYREKKSCDPVRERASLNREEFKILMREMLHEMPAEICLNALSVEKTLTLLLKQWKSCQNPLILKTFEEIGCRTFYMFIDMVSDPVRQFPPTMQFFSTCVELIGRTFIMENKTQTEALLRTILARPKIVGLLLPIFQPGTCEDSFTEMYENVIQTSLDIEVKFSLLSKFDFRSWLASKPILSERMAMMKVLFAALCDCGFEPPAKTTMLSEIYLRKVSVLLIHQFPDLFGETLSLLIHGSADHAVCLNAWNEFLITTKVLVKDMAKRELTLNTTPPFLLQNEQVNETMIWLMEYFHDQRLSCAAGSNEGILTLWKPYLPSLIALCEYISRHTIAAHEHQLAENNIEVLKFLWNRISDFFSPWISPCEVNSELVLPWSEMEESEALEFVGLYIRVLVYFQNFLPAPLNGKPNILSLVFDLYSSMTTKHSLPGHFLRVYHASFTCLSWNVFSPNVSHLESMLQISSISGSCRGFLIEIFPSISWLEVLERFRSVEGTTTLRECQDRLFNLIIVLGNEKSIIQNEECKMLSLLENAVNFVWDLMSGSTFRAVCDWLVSNCDFVQILKPSSLLWKSIRLLEAACLLTSSSKSERSYSDIPEKRLHYFNSMVKLLCKCSANPEHAAGLYRPVIEQLMDSVLLASTSDATNSQSVMYLYVEILNLLNSLSPKEKILVLALETIQEKIHDLTQTNVILAMIMAACRSLASISLMVQVVEAAVETHFNNTKLPPSNDANVSQDSLVEPWSDVLASVTVPELSQRDFVQECINHSAVLTLFTHTVQCLSRSQSAAEEFIMLKELNAWTASIKPSNPDTESKIILLWYKILQLLVRQVDYEVNLRDLSQQVDFLIPYITHAGEDRDTTGLLGVIGLGRKSTLTPSFRFLCRALSTFLSAQLPSNGQIRVKANAPGEAKATAKKEGTSGVGASQRTNSGFHNLQSLRLNKTYSGLVEQIEFACSFILNPKHCLREGPELLKKMTKDLFRDKSYLGLAV